MESHTCLKLTVSFSHGPFHLIFLVLQTLSHMGKAEVTGGPLVCVTMHVGINCTFGVEESTPYITSASHVWLQRHMHRLFIILSGRECFYDLLLQQNLDIKHISPSFISVCLLMAVMWVKVPLSLGLNVSGLTLTDYTSVFQTCWGRGLKEWLDLLAKWNS